jgi:hypothetical protein
MPVAKKAEVPPKIVRAPIMLIREGLSSRFKLIWHFTFGVETEDAHCNVTHLC